MDPKTYPAPRLTWQAAGLIFSAGSVLWLVCVGIARLLLG
jgi:hypothetical protein